MASELSAAAIKPAAITRMIVLSASAFNNQCTTINAAKETLIVVKDSRVVIGQTHWRTSTLFRSRD
jgi:hypothetical protein